MNILTIGFTTEGTTDQRFLGNIIRKTFEELAINCIGQIEVYEPQHILIKEETFVQNIVEASKMIPWANVLCIHTDSDNNRDNIAFNNKINPSLVAVNSIVEKSCKNIVPIVPVHMTEAWMLADRELFKKIIFSSKTLQELNLPIRYNQIELLDDPKMTIENAIRIAFSEFPRRRKKINISELYVPISQRIDLTILSNLPSYRKFKESAIQALRFLNYMEC
jgi:hypothetical protein